MKLLYKSGSRSVCRGDPSLATNGGRFVLAAHVVGRLFIRGDTVAQFG